VVARQQTPEPQSLGRIPDRSSSARSVFASHGGKSIFLARFIPVVRAAGAFTAGVARMDWWWFFLWNLAGGVAWAATIAFVAYHLGAAAAATIGRLGPVCAAVAITGAATVFIVNRVRRANVRKRNVLARPRLSFAKTPSGSRDRVHASDMSKQRRWSRPTDHRAGILSGSKPRDQPPPR
jgi:hypothetical protein